MTRIHLGASRRLPPRITMLSTPKYKWKEERKRVLKLSVKKLRSIEDPEAFLSRSVLINNTLKRLQSEVREEKAKKSTALATYSPSPYSFYSIEKAYREEVERLDNNNGSDTTAELSSGFSVNHGVEDIVEDDASEMFEADDEAEDDSDEASSSGSDSSSSEDENDEETNDNKLDSSSSSDRVPTPMPRPESEDKFITAANSLEEELLADMPPPSLPPPPQMILEEKPKPLASSSRLLLPEPSNIEAVMKSSECCDNSEDLYSEAVRTECWTKPTPARTTLSSSSAVNTWPNLEWPTYVPSTASTTTSAASSTSFSPNISVPMCSSHKENLFQMSVERSTPIEKCYSCGQSSLFQSELQSVVFNSLITSLET